MKKLLIPVLCCLVATWSCGFESSYYVENAQDIVTILEHQLVNDNGVVYTLSEKAVASLPDLEEDKRYYIVFDILNQQYQIRLRNAIEAHIVTPEELPEQTEGLGSDPISFQFAQMGRKHLDMGINYYFAAGSDYAHQIKFYCTLENAGSQMNIHIYHDGNNENPTTLAEKDIKMDSRIISIPVSEWKTVNEVNIYCDVLAKDPATGEQKITRRMYSLN